MPHKKHYSSRKNIKGKTKMPLIASVLIITVLAGGGFLAYTYILNTEESSETITSTEEGPVNFEPPTEEQIEAQDEEKAGLPKDSDAPVNNSTPISSEVIVSSAYQELSNIVVMTKLVGNGWDTCNLVLTNGSSTISRSSETLYQESFSTCLGFDIEVNDFPVSGTWQVDLSATKIDGQSLSSETATVEVTK